MRLDLRPVQLGVFLLLEPGRVMLARTVVALPTKGRADGGLVGPIMGQFNWTSRSVLIQGRS